MAPEPKTTTDVALYTDDDARLMGLPTPGAINMLSTFCAQFVNTPLCPPSLSKGNPAANMMAVVLTGKEMGLSPMQCLRGFFLGPDGRLGMEGSLMMAVMRTHGISFTWHRMDNEGCKVTGKRKDTGEELTIEFNVDDAKRAGIYQRDKSQWPKYPKTMCRHRCEGEMFRALCSDLGGNSIYERTELEDMAYETVTSSPDGVEVQTPREEPAKAGKRPKANAEPSSPPPVTTPPAPSAKPADEPAPVKVEPPPPKYYVISSATTLPALDVIQQGEVERLQLAVLETAELPLAMQNSDKWTKDTNTEHFVLRFDKGVVTKLHTSKLAKKRWYVAIEEDTYNKFHEDRIKVLEEAVTKPGNSQSAMEMVCSSKAIDIRRNFLLLSFFSGEPFTVESKFQPPAPKIDPPTAKPPVTDEATAARVEQFDEKTRVKTYYESLLADIKAPLTSRAPIANKFLVAFLGISDTKNLAQDLGKFSGALDAMAKAIPEYPDFVARPDEIGRIEREKLKGNTPQAPTPPPAPKDPDREIMVKYYEERQWTGNTTSLAEAWRRREKITPEVFAKTTRYSGIEQCSDKNAAAFYEVSLQWKEIGNRFAVEVEQSAYHQTLMDIRNAFDGQQLSAIDPAKFLEVMERITKEGTAPLFA